MTEPQAPWPDGEVLAGIVERVTFHNAESGFAVLRVKARGYRDLVTIVGHAAAIAAGEWITATGEWVNDRTHGQQFKARFPKTSAPTTAEGIERYLSSGMIRGIGPVYAKKLVRGFGEAVFDIIEGAPERLREVGGIGEMPWPAIDAEKAIPWVERRIGMTLTESKRQAVGLALAAKLLVITGGPGVGKTTIMRAILAILAAKRVAILLAAPTGRAAKRMSGWWGSSGAAVRRARRAAEEAGVMPAKPWIRPPRGIGRAPRGADPCLSPLLLLRRVLRGPRSRRAEHGSAQRDAPLRRVWRKR